MNPSLKTQSKYGLDLDGYRTLWDRQKGKCGCCQEPFGKFMVFIDHEHVKGFSSMTADDKRKHIRGLLCYMCNRFKVCKNDLTSARAVVRYLEQDRIWTNPILPLSERSNEVALEDIRQCAAEHDPSTGGGRPCNRVAGGSGK